VTAGASGNGGPPVDPRLAPALRAARTILGLDFEALETLSGVPERKLRRFELGTAMPTHGELSLIWRAIVDTANGILPTPIDESRR
jgi:hypothetical protein